MNRQQKEEILQRELSRKDLSTWCLVKTMFTEDKELYIEEHRSEATPIIKWNFFDHYSTDETKTDIECILYVDYMQEVWFLKDAEEYEILWHPVILSDILVWCSNNSISVMINWNWELRFHKNMDYKCNWSLTNLYLSEQSDEVISILFELFLFCIKEEKCVKNVCELDI